MSSFDWDKPLFEKKRISLQKVLANANKAIEKSTRFINKIKSRQIACADRAKSIPKNVSIEKSTLSVERRFVNKSTGLTTMLIGKILKARS
jgi:hypothetical protein